MSTPPSGSAVAVELLLAGRALIDELHRRLAVAGHPDLRPAHGFVFQALGPDGATASEIAGRLGVTKQAARLVLGELADAGYVTTGADPRDARRRPARLTARGTDALTRSAAILDELVGDLGSTTVRDGMALLEGLTGRYGPAPLRPVW